MPAALIACLLATVAPRERAPICEWKDSVQVWIQAYSKALLVKQKHQITNARCPVKKRRH